MRVFYIIFIAGMLSVDHTILADEYYANQVAGTDCDCVVKRLGEIEDKHGISSVEAHDFMLLAKNCGGETYQEIMACSEDL